MLDLEFKVVEKKGVNQAEYSADCSGSRSDCCTRVCTRDNVNKNDQSSFQAWEKYLEVNAGVLQY